MQENRIVKRNQEKLSSEDLQLSFCISGAAYVNSLLLPSAWSTGIRTTVPRSSKRAHPLGQAWHVTGPAEAEQVEARRRPALPPAAGPQLRPHVRAGPPRPPPRDRPASGESAGPAAPRVPPRQLWRGGRASGGFSRGTTMSGNGLTYSEQGGEAAPELAQEAAPTVTPSAPAAFGLFSSDTKK